MKTIKTAGQVIKIEDHDVNLIPLFLQEQLQEYRAKLITNLLGGLDAYVGYKFKITPNRKQIIGIRKHLMQLQKSRLNLDNYQFILEQTLRKDTITLDSGLFYIEIDRTIENVLMAGKDVNEERFDADGTPIFNSNDLLRFIRKGMVQEIQTPEGLLKYIKENYNVNVSDKAKLDYILAEVIEYFKSEPVDAKWIREIFNKHDFESFESGNKFILEQEMSSILKKHFEHAI
jgi:hypothetical protein